MNSVEITFFPVFLDKESSKEGGSKGESESDKTSTKSKTTETAVKNEKAETKFVPTTNNDVRQKCREMIVNSLKTSENDGEGIN